MAFLATPVIPTGASSFFPNHTLSRRKPDAWSPPTRRHASTRLTPRCATVVTAPAERKAALLEALKVVQDPDLGEDIVTLGFVKDVSFTEVTSMPGMFDTRFIVELTTPACPVKEQFRTDCVRIAEGLPFVRQANVVMTAQAPSENTSAPSNELRNIGAVIAVASCKGGVGKSTTAVNLAFALAKRGARVGLFDADIYGPSLPTLVTPDSESVTFEGNLIRPLMAQGVSLMSFGYINPNAAVMRGPRVAALMTQLLTTTAWGALDYLIVDMPPGTGDVQLTLCQTLRLSAAVVVTTPQQLAYVDVVKGIDMFHKVRVSCVAVVENMAYFVTPDTGQRHQLFGPGHAEQLQAENDIPCIVQVPVDPKLSTETGVPFVVGHADSETATQYAELADGVVREVAKIQHGGLKVPIVEYDEHSGDIIVRREGSDHVQRIWPPELRRQCKCAACLDEMTGRPLLNPDSVKENVKPIRIERVGNYAVDVVWSDGHLSLYPYARFVEQEPAEHNDPVVDENVEIATPVSP